MDLLVLPLLLFALGTGIGVVSKAFQDLLGICDRLCHHRRCPFSSCGADFSSAFLTRSIRLPLLSSWLILFAFGTAAYLAYRALQKYKRHN